MVADGDPVHVLFVTLVLNALAVLKTKVFLRPSL